MASLVATPGTTPGRPSEARYELAVELAARHGLDAQAVEDSIFRQYEVTTEVTQ